MFSRGVLSSVKELQKTTRVLSSKTFSVTFFIILLIITTIILVSIYI
jgi:hypothetical protein